MQQRRGGGEGQGSCCTAAAAAAQISAALVAAVGRLQLVALLETVASTPLPAEKEHFAELAVDAVLRLKGSTNLDAIQIIKKPGGTIKVLRGSGVWLVQPTDRLAAGVSKPPRAGRGCGCRRQGHLPPPFHPTTHHQSIKSI